MVVFKYELDGNKLTITERVQNVVSNYESGVSELSWSSDYFVITNRKEDGDKTHSEKTTLRKG